MFIVKSFVAEFVCLLRYKNYSSRMSAKAIREATGKEFINSFLVSNGIVATSRFVTVSADTNWDSLISANPWLKSEVCYL